MAETVAERVVSVLAELGTPSVHGLPGEDHLSLLDALGAAELPYHPAINESSAVIMAATEAAVCGTCGVALVSLAPGASNAVNGLAHAYAEQLPVVVISGRQGAREKPFVVRQGQPPGDVVRPVVKWSAAVSTNDDPASLLLKAIAVAGTEPRGPVYLEIPEEWARQEIAGAPLADSRRASGGVRSPAPLLDQVEALRERLVSAVRPCLIVGASPADPPHFGSVVEKFARRFRCPIFVTPRRIGSVDPAHELFGGVFLNSNLETGVLGRSDLVLALSIDGIDIYNTPWRYPQTVAVAWRRDVSALYSFEDEIETSPCELLEALLATQDGEAPRSEWTPDEIARYRSDGRRAVFSAEAECFGVPSALDALLTAMPTGTTVVADAGFSKPLLLTTGAERMTGRFLASNGLSTMGFALPAGIACARSDDRPVLALMGDGSALMRITELVHTDDLRAPLVVAIVADRSLTQIRVKQARQRFRTVGVALPHVDWPALAGALGVRAMSTAHDRESLLSAAQDAFRTQGATVIGIHVEMDSAPAIFELLRG